MGVWRSLYVCFWFVLLIVLRPLGWWWANAWWIIIRLHSIVQCPAQTVDNSALYVNCLVKFITLRDNCVHDNQVSVQHFWQIWEGLLEILALYKSCSPDVKFVIPWKDPLRCLKLIDPISKFCIISMTNIIMISVKQNHIA